MEEDGVLAFEDVCLYVGNEIFWKFGSVTVVWRELHMLVCSLFLYILSE